MVKPLKTRRYWGCPGEDKRQDLRASGSRKRLVQSHASHLEQVGHVLAALAVLDELAGVLYLLPGFGLGPGPTPRARADSAS